MLDANEFRLRLRAVMDRGKPPIRSSDLARRMGVERQDVYEWRKTGRFAKGRLLQLSEVTGTPVTFWLEPVRASTPETKRVWAKLGPMLRRVVGLVLAVLSVAAQFDNNAFATTKHAQVPVLIHIRQLLTRLYSFWTGR